MSFDFYFAGTQCKETEDLIVQLNANSLKSYVNDRKELLRWYGYKQRGWKGKLMLDNGAFTYHRKGGVINIDSYISYINDNIEYLDYAIALDDIPGKWGEIKTLEQVTASPINTWNNYLYMIERVKQPEKLLPVFHMGENFIYLEKMVNSENLLSDYICISGNKELTNKQREDWYSKCFSIIKKSKNPNIKVHCLGSATIQNAEKFPFTSMDATSWIMCGANGSILTDKGAVYVGKNVLLSDVEIQELQKILDSCGYTVDDVVNDYKARMLVNIYYLYNKSRQSELKGHQSFSRRLF